MACHSNVIFMCVGRPFSGLHHFHTIINLSFLPRCIYLLFVRPFLSLCRSLSLRTPTRRHENRISILFLAQPISEHTYSWVFSSTLLIIAVTQQTNPMNLYNDISPCIQRKFSKRSIQLTESIMWVYLGYGVYLNTEKCIFWQAHPQHTSIFDIFTTQWLEIRTNYFLFKWISKSRESVVIRELKFLFLEDMQFQSLSLQYLQILCRLPCIPIQLNEWVRGNALLYHLHGKTYGCWTCSVVVFI